MGRGRVDGSWEWSSQSSVETSFFLRHQLTIKALHVAPTSSLGGPECCLRVSMMPLRLNVDQVSGWTRAEPGVTPSPSAGPESDPELFLQDALFFLKDFFTSLAAGINPMVPGDTSAEGERPGLVGSLDSGRLNHPQFHPGSVTSLPAAHRETHSRPSSPQEGQSEGTETSSPQEAPGSGHSSSDPQPIYFR